MIPCDGVYLGGPISLGTLLPKRSYLKISFFLKQMLGFSPDDLDSLQCMHSAVLEWKESQKVLGECAKAPIPCPAIGTCLFSSRNLAGISKVTKVEHVRD